jgi:hypothetical protein
MSKFLTLLCLVLMVSAVCFAQTTEAEKVKQAFNGYKSAILNNKAEDALKLISSSSVKYYNHIIELIRTADSAKLNDLSILDKITVLSIRSRAAKEELLQMNGEELFLYSIRNGMVGKNSVANNSVGDVSVVDGFAKAQLLNNGVKTPLFFHFYKEDGNWKFDLTSLFTPSVVAMKKMVSDSGKSENEFIIFILENMTGEKLGADIWKPL